MAWALAALLFLVPLTGRGQVADTASYLPLPEVPSSLRTPATRAAYILSHFWDSLDFSTDTLQTRDPDFMERNLANYLSLFPVADTAALAPAVGTLVADAGTDKAALSVLLELVGKYLYEPESPVYNEMYYALFAEAFLQSPVDSYEKIRLRAQLEAVRKNSPGTAAADFTYETPAGKRLRMSETGTGKPLLLLFYDPDCAHCREVMTELEAMESLRQAMECGTVTVLVIYSGFDDRETWRRTLPDLPAAWTVGYDNGTIYTENLYIPRRLPAVYLLDAQRRVVTKDPTPECLAEQIGEMMKGKKE